MSLELVFRNKITNRFIDGTVLPSDSLSSILQGLKEAGIVLNDTDVFRKANNEIIEAEIAFQNLGLKNGDTVFVTAIEKKEEINRDKSPFMKPPKAPRTFHQLGVFVLDGSHSMNDMGQGNIPKKDAVNIAISALLADFKKSRKSANFSFSVVCFGEKATENLGITLSENINELVSFDPTIGHNGGTLIHSGLTKAEEISISFLDQAKKDGVPHSVVILLLSDGECHQPEATLQVAKRIKANPKINICTTFLSTQEDAIHPARDFMKLVANNAATDFQSTYDAKSLRAFFESSISKVR